MVCALSMIVKKENKIVYASYRKTIYLIKLMRIMITPIKILLAIKIYLLV